MVGGTTHAFFVLFFAFAGAQPKARGAASGQSNREELRRKATASCSGSSRGDTCSFEMWYEKGQVNRTMTGYCVSSQEGRLYCGKTPDDQMKKIEEIRAFSCQNNAKEDVCSYGASFAQMQVNVTGRCRPQPMQPGPNNGGPGPKGGGPNGGGPKGSGPKGGGPNGGGPKGGGSKGGGSKSDSSKGGGPKGGRSGAGGFTGRTPGHKHGKLLCMSGEDSSSGRSSGMRGERNRDGGATGIARPNSPKPSADEFIRIKVMSCGSKSLGDTCSFKVFCEDYDRQITGHCRPPPKSSGSDKTLACTFGTGGKSSAQGADQRNGPGGPQRSGPGGPQRSGPGGPQRSGPGHQRSGPGHDSGHRDSGRAKPTGKGRDDRMSVGLSGNMKQADETTNAKEDSTPDEQSSGLTIALGCAGGVIAVLTAIMVFMLVKMRKLTVALSERLDKMEEAQPRAQAVGACQPEEALNAGVTVGIPVAGTAMRSS